ncbi:MAG: electron transport complex subunit E [Woeseiaceae bacterium]|nr:electron transport complex subunit E [Woeseiaceae bacterium]
MSSIVERFRNGLWRDNPGLVQLLGLCPLLAVTSTFINGLGLGIATLCVLVVSNGLVSATRRWIRTEIRIPIYVLIIASLVTCAELIFKAWFPALDRSLGIFIPLIVTNCAIVARAEIYASRNPVGSSIIDGLVMGTGFALLLMALGAFRQLVSMVWLLALLPPGAFFSLALAIAAKNAIDGKRRAKRHDALQRPSRVTNR